MKILKLLGAAIGYIVSIIALISSGAAIVGIFICCSPFLLSGIALLFIYKISRKYVKLTSRRIAGIMGIEIPEEESKDDGINKMDSTPTPGCCG